MVGTPFFASRCGAVPISYLRNRSRCSAVSILVHPVVNPQIWTLRHASGDMDLVPGSQMRMLRQGSGDMDLAQVPDLESGDMDLAEDPAEGSHLRMLRHRFGDMDPQT